MLIWSLELTTNETGLTLVELILIVNCALMLVGLGLGKRKSMSTPKRQNLGLEPERVLNMPNFVSQNCDHVKAKRDVTKAVVL